jgi:hypothetical protein
MAKRGRGTTTEPKGPTKLTVPLTEARRMITAQIEAGQQLLAKNVSPHELKPHADHWTRFNWDLLSRIFSDTEFASEVDYAPRGIGVLSGNPFGGPPPEDVRGEVESRTAALRSILGRLELLVDPETDAAALAPVRTCYILPEEHDVLA